MGDVVLSLPALAAVRRHFPNARISVLSGKIPGEVIKLSGLADEAITVDRVELRDGPKLHSIRKVFVLVGEMRQRRFDLVIDLHSLSETNILAFLSSKHRLLANRESRSLDVLSNFDPRPPKEDKTKHLTERYFDVLRPLGIDEHERTFRLTATEKDVEFVDQKYFNDLNEQPIGLFLGAGHPDRCWPLKNFAELAQRIVEDGKKAAVFLGPEEAGMRGQVAALFPPDTMVVDGLSISQFIAAASRLEAFVTNDTGPMHLAACSGTPILLILDGKAPDTYLPLSDRLMALRDGDIGKMSVDAVYDALVKLVGDIQTAKQ